MIFKLHRGGAIWSSVVFPAAYGGDTKTGLYYDCHPVTQTAFKGFTVPMFDEAVTLCLQAAQVKPDLAYIGWDVAITPDKPVLIEGNILPGYDMVQNSKFNPDGKGLLPTVEAIIGGPVPKA